MTQTSAVEPSRIRHELRFASRSDRGRDYTFPCDAHGHVDIDTLSDLGRTNYFFARAMVGSMLSAPIVSRLP
jgi:hypothetical protein